MKILIRADASSEIGAGHVMRCLALAQACQDAGGAAEFLSAALPAGLESRLRAENFMVHRINAKTGGALDAEATVKTARECDAAWIVADGYFFAGDFQETIKRSDRRLMVVDDTGHLDRYCGDIVLNQNPQANARMYARRAADTELLLGSRYAMLRREFRTWRNRPEKGRAVRRLLVTLGGADPANTTLKIIRAVQELGDLELEVVVLIGAANPHRPELEGAVRAHGRPIELRNSVSNMPELMEWADFAVSAAGSTCWELAYMGVPNLAIVLADNQSEGAESLQRMNVSRNLGWHANLTPKMIAEELTDLFAQPEARHRMSDCGRALIDGDGAPRVIEALRGRATPVPATDARSLQLRAVTMDDAKLLWTWANDPEVRASAFNQSAIAWEEHVAWLGAKLQDANCCLLLASDESGEPVGQIRFDVCGDEAEIDVSVAAAVRGRGLASQLITAGVSYASAARPSLKVFRASVKNANRRSSRAFVRAGFEPVEARTHRGEAVTQLSRDIRPIAHS